MAKKANKTEEQFSNVEENLSKAGLYVVKNQKRIVKLVFILIGIIASFAIFNKFYKIKSVWPIKIYSVESINQSNADLFQAEFNIKNKKFYEALYGDTTINPIDSSRTISKGLTEVILNYPYTDAENLANYYSAICQMNLGSSLDSSLYFKKALISLDNFSTNTKSLSFNIMVKKYWWIALDLVIIIILLYFLYFKKERIRGLPYIIISVLGISIFGMFFNGEDKKVDDRDIIRSIVTGLKGDANMELGNTVQAISFYKSAATDYRNSLTTPYFMMKEAAIHETNKDYSLALEIYNIIKSDYPESKQAINIDIYISSASNR